MTRPGARELAALALCALVFHSSARADDSWSDAESETWRLEAALTFNRFEQQVKTEIGGVAAEPVVEESSAGLALTATYNVWRFFRLGLYLQIDGGSRYAGRFVGVDADGNPLVDRSGGGFAELWAGPVLRIQWRGLFAEVAYGALGLRRDAARSDLPSEDGGTEGLFRVSPRIAWSFGVGGFVPVHPNIDVVLRLQYRVRYYTQRGGSGLAGDLVHGTQNLAPFIGVAWHRSR